MTTQACAASVSQFVPADRACFRPVWQQRGEPELAGMPALGIGFTTEVAYER
jgi:hypothetical protein